ncbi:MAG: hypothetical protein AMXMBFR64_40800 [Myxococcales bacterium]
MRRHSWFALVVAVALSGSTAWSAPPTDDAGAPEAFARARAAFKRGAFDEAIALLQAAQSAEPRAVYVFNIARSYEEMGFLREAYDHFVLYPSQPRTTPELVAEAATRAAALAPLLQRAAVDLRSLPATTRASLDGGLVPNEVLPVAPGAHTLCVLPSETQRASCWTRDLDVARRVVWPPDGGERGTVALPPGATVRIDGRVLPFAPGVSAVELDAGVHAVEVTASGAPPQTLRVEVLSGAHVTLAEPGAVAEPTNPGPWVLVGVGSAAAAAGAGLLIAALVESQPLASSQRDGGVITGLTQAEAQRLGDEVDTLVLSGSVLAGAGAALVAGGLTWWALESEPTDGTEAAGRLWVAPTSLLSVGVGGTF